ncbi:putative hexose transporter [Trypanosoma cruzi]|nr:putative hexose transporter [Trypanosoma cruzi]
MPHVCRPERPPEVPSRGRCSVSGVHHVWHYVAAMGLAIGQSVNFDKDIKMDARMQGYCAFSTLLSVLMVALGILGREQDEVYERQARGRWHCAGPERVQLPADAWTFGDGTSDFRDAATDWHQCRDELRAKDYGQLGDGASCGQLRGDGVELCDNSRLDSTCPVLTMRQLFLGASLVASVSCLLLCGVPVYPGVADKNVKNGVAITGIAVFIAAFEIGLGPCFFVLAQELFPRSFRPRGSSFVLLTNFIFNVIINVCYPIATEGISGGPSGNQDKGQAVAFIFFGCIGLVCFVLQVFFLYPWEEHSSEPRRHQRRVRTSRTQSPIEVATPGNRQAA